MNIKQQQAQIEQLKVDQQDATAQEQAELLERKNAVSLAIKKIHDGQEPDDPVEAANFRANRDAIRSELNVELRRLEQQIRDVRDRGQLVQFNLDKKSAHLASQPGAN